MRYGTYATANTVASPVGWSCADRDITMDANRHRPEYRHPVPRDGAERITGGTGREGDKLMTPARTKIADSARRVGR